MKIVVLGLRGFPDVQGGVETHCEHLFTRIAARGHEVTVLGRKPYMQPGRSEYRGVRLVALPCPRHRFLEAFLHTVIGVFRARRLRPDILHIHAIGPSLLVPVAKLLGMTVVSTNHGPDYDRAKWGRLARVILRLGESVASRYADGVIAISRPIAEHLRRSFGREPVLIPNGVVPLAPSSARDVLALHELEPKRYVLAVGRLVPEKGLHDLMDAFVRANLAGWKLVIAGGADHEDAYSKSLKQSARGLPAVVMTGFVKGEALVQLYSHAGLFVLPSYHEGLPIALLEAMSFGLPVLASDIPANREAGVPEDRLFPVGDVDSAARAISRLVQQPYSAAEKAGQVDFITRTFDWEAIAEKTLKLYAMVVDNRRL